MISAGKRFDLPSSIKNSGIYVGVDLIALRRVRHFLQAHSKRKIQTLLAPCEQKIISSKNSLMMLARLFCAKEAYFKTLNQSWLGIEGFSKIEIIPTMRDQFQASWLDPKRQRKWLAQGCWTSVNDHVMAQVIRWE